MPRGGAIGQSHLRRPAAAQAPDGSPPPASPADLSQTYLATVSAQLPHAAMPWAVAPLFLALHELRQIGDAA